MLEGTQLCPLSRENPKEVSAWLYTAEIKARHWLSSTKMYFAAKSNATASPLSFLYNWDNLELNSELMNPLSTPD